jgi:hypothetical protein
MLHLYYKWRYRRKQGSGAFKLPNHNLGGHSFRVNFNSYLAQPDVKGRHFNRYDLPHKRRRWVRILLTLLALLALSWLVYESIAALATFSD